MMQHYISVHCLLLQLAYTVRNYYCVMMNNNNNQSNSEYHGLQYSYSVHCDGTSDTLIILYDKYIQDTFHIVSVKLSNCYTVIRSEQNIFLFFSCY